MSKIRINELARELEVKPNKILELLAELGVDEKKTHSSSIDDDVALKIRRQFGFDEPAAAPEVSVGAAAAAGTTDAPIHAPQVSERPIHATPPVATKSVPVATESGKKETVSLTTIVEPPLKSGSPRGLSLNRCVLHWRAATRRMHPRSHPPPRRSILFAKRLCIIRPRLSPR